MSRPPTNPVLHGALVLLAAASLLLAGCSTATTADSRGASSGGSTPSGSRPGTRGALTVAETDASPPAAQVGSWAGAIAGSNAFVAIVSSGHQLMAYVCDSNEIGQWFRADLADNDPVVFNAAGWTLSVHLDAGTARGSVTTPDGEAVPIDLPPSPAAPALYRAEQNLERGAVLAGWVVLPNGDQRGLLTFTPATAKSTSSTSTSTATAPPAGTAITKAAPLLPATPPGTPVSPIPANLPDLVGVDLQPNPVTTEALGAGTPNVPFEYVMVTLGDSYASGEGAPNVNGQFDDGGQLPAGRTKETWSNQPPNHPDVEACHRSEKAAGPQVAADLTAEFPQVKVIHQSFACSGAKIENIRNTTYPGADGHVNDVTVSPQLTQVQNWFKKTGPVSFPGTVDKVDLVYMNIGGNNAGFGDVIGACIGPFSNCATDNALHAILTTNLAALRGKYGALGTALRSLSYQKPTGQNVAIAPAKVVIQTIPNPLRNQNGVLCNGPDEERMKHEQLNELTSNEAAWAETDVLGPLNAAVTDAALQNGWTAVAGITDAFRTHGICSTTPWINNIRDGLRHQGEDIRLDGFAGFLNGTFLVNLSAGMVHPNATGYRAIADKADDTVRPTFVTRWTPATPGRLRVGKATFRDNIELRWDDTSNNEQRFEIEERALDADGTFLGPFVDVAAADHQVATVSLNGTFTAQYRIRACGPATGDKLCSPWSDPIVASNIAPREPANVTGTAAPIGLSSNYRARVGFADQAGPTKAGGSATMVAQLTKGADVRQFVIRSATSTATVALAGPGLGDVIPAGEWRLVLRACNPAGCADGPPVTVTIPSGPPPTTTTSSTGAPKFTTTTVDPSR